MNKQAFIQNIQQSALSDENKKKVLDLLSENELTFDIKEHIKDIIQEDIERDSIMFDGVDAVEIATIETELAHNLSLVEAGLASDMTLVESELGELESMAADMGKAVDEAQIDAIKADIQA